MKPSAWAQGPTALTLDDVVILVAAGFNGTMSALDAVRELNGFTAGDWVHRGRLALEVALERVHAFEPDDDVDYAVAYDQIAVDLHHLWGVRGFGACLALRGPRVIGPVAP